MFYINFDILNPFKFKYREQHDYVCYDRNLSKYKNFEIQITRWSPGKLLSILIDTQWFGQDHAGFRLNLEMLGFYIGIQIYDSRHWNYDEQRWYTDAEIQAEIDEYHKELAEQGQG